VDDKAVERAIEAFGDKDRREAFYAFFKELQTLYEIISPDVFLREHLDGYTNLAALHDIVRNAFSKKAALYRDLARKTEMLVRERVESGGLATTMPLVRIDEKALEALKRGEPPSTSRVLNLGKSLLQAVEEEGGQQPYLLPIGDRTEAVLEAYDDRQINTQAALTELEKLLREFVEARRAREVSGFDVNTFTIFWVLKQAGSPEAGTIAPRLEEAFRRFPNQAHNPEERRRLKAELYKVLLPAVGKDRMVGIADWLLGLPRK